MFELGCGLLKRAAEFFFLLINSKGDFVAGYSAYQTFMFFSFFFCCKVMLLNNT